jgi:hypothetical protein
MNYFPYLLLLVSLSSLSLIIFILLRIMDFANVVANQKIILLKIGLVMIAVAPCIFILSREWRRKNAHQTTSRRLA